MNQSRTFWIVKAFTNDFIKNEQTLISDESFLPINWSKMNDSLANDLFGTESFAKSFIQEWLDQKWPIYEEHRSSWLIILKYESFSFNKDFSFVNELLEKNSQENDRSRTISSKMKKKIDRWRTNHSRSVNDFINSEWIIRERIDKKWENRCERTAKMNRSRMIWSKMKKLSVDERIICERWTISSKISESFANELVRGTRT